MRSQRLLRLRRKFWRTQLYVLLIVLSAIYLVPFFWAFTTSLKDRGAIFEYPPRLFPREFRFQNYLEAFSMYPWLTFFRNSVIITTLSVLGTLLSSPFIAFGFAVLRFPGRRALFFLVLLTMMIPYYTTLIPRYMLFKQLGWIDTFYPLFVPDFFGNAFFIFLLRQYFMGIPRSLFEAAKIDGASTLRIYWNIYFPLARPAVITVGILQFMTVWSDFIGPLIFLQSPEHYTLVLGLNAFRGVYFTYWHYLCAMALVISIPPIIFFFIGQKRIIGGITISGLK